MGSECGNYELVVDLRGAVADAGHGVARLCGARRQTLLGQPVTSLLRGRAMTAPMGTSAPVTIKSDSGSQPGIAVRCVDGERIRITVLPAVPHDGPVVQPDEQHVRLVEEVVRDVQNPLTGIIGFAALSRVAPSPHRRRYYLDQVISQAQRCRRVIQSLDASLHDLVPNPSTIDLVAETALAVNGLCAQLEVHGISVDMELPGDPVWVRLDATLYGDAVNAILHRATLGVRGDYRAREVAVGVAVGEGEATLELVFTGAEHVNGMLADRFDIDHVPGHTPTISDVELQTARDLLHEQGGRLSVQASEDLASVCVLLTVPRSNPPARVDLGRTPVPLNLLALDDDAVLGELYIELLGVSGHTVTACRSLAGAREALNHQRFDAVISDLFFQDGTLPELWAEAADHHPELRDRLLVITSDQANPRAREWLTRADAPILAKPFSTRNLLWQLNSLTS